jgi:hypothetical protein
VKKGELIVAAGFILLAGIVIGDMLRTGMGWTEYGPDAGFVPFWEGMLLMVSAIIILISGLKQKGGENFFVSKSSWEYTSPHFSTPYCSPAGWESIAGFHASPLQSLSPCSFTSAWRRA